MPNRSDHENKLCGEIHPNKSHSDWLLSEHDGVGCVLAHKWCAHSTWRHTNEGVGDSCQEIHLTYSHRAWSFSERGYDKRPCETGDLSDTAPVPVRYSEHKGVPCEKFHPEKFYGNEFASHTKWLSDNDGLTVDMMEQEHSYLPCQIEHPSYTHKKWFESGGQIPVDDAVSGEFESTVTDRRDQSAPFDRLDHDDRDCSIVHHQQSHSDWLITDHSPNNCEEEHPWCNHRIWRHDVRYYDDDSSKQLCDSIHPDQTHIKFEHWGWSCIRYHSVQSHEKWFIASSFLSADMAAQEHPGKSCGNEHTGDHLDWLSSNKRKPELNKARGDRIEKLRVSRTPQGFDPSQKSDFMGTLFKWGFGLFILIVIFSALGQCSGDSYCEDPRGCGESPREAQSG